MKNAEMNKYYKEIDRKYKELEKKYNDLYDYVSRIRLRVDDMWIDIKVLSDMLEGDDVDENK